jgi:hypothetical protein
MTRAWCLNLSGVFLISLVGCGDGETKRPGVPTQKATASGDPQAEPRAEENRDLQLDRVKATAVGKALDEVFGGWQEKVYIEQSPYVDESLSKIGECEVEVITRDHYNSHLANHKPKPTLAEIRVFHKDGESENQFHVVISYKGWVGIGGYWDGRFRIEGQKAVLVDKSYSME